MKGYLDARDPAGSLRKLVSRLRGLERELTAAELEATLRSERARYVDSLRSERALAGEVVWQLQAGQTADAVYERPRLRGWTVPRLRQVAQRWLSGAQPSIVVSNAPNGLASSPGFPVTVRRLRWTLDGAKE